MAIAVAFVTLIAMAIRPWRTSEWMWAAGGAITQLLLGSLPPARAWGAIADGADVYLFLIGILVLAEVARSQSVFVWLAGHADALAGRSRYRLLLVLYGVGVIVTATLSNDTTIILLTPAALALAKRVGGSPLPYAFACAFVANAASFLLPTGNPANLLLYGSNVPSLTPWIRTYGAASLAAILITYLVLTWLYRDELKQPPAASDDRPRSNGRIRLAFSILIGSSIALCVASICGFQLGQTAFACGAVAALALSAYDRTVPAHLARNVSWSIVPLVASLLVVVAALEAAGVTSLARSAIDTTSLLPHSIASEAAGITTAALANIANNLPIAAFAANALSTGTHPFVAHAITVGIDLGPNLSLSGSLATLLWVLLLRRDGISVSPLRFLARGALVTAPALVAALLLVR